MPRKTISKAINANLYNRVKANVASLANVFAAKPAYAIA